MINHAGKPETMTAHRFSRLAFAAALAPLVLGLAACNNKGEDAPAGLSGQPIAKIAPPAGKAWSDVVTITPELGYRMGNPEAPIKLVEYASLTCPHCAEFSHEATAELRDQFVASGRVSYEMRNMIRDGLDLYLTQLTRCGAPEGYFALTDQTFANQAAFFKTAQDAGKAAQEAAFSQPPEKRGLAIANLAGMTDFFAARGISKEQAAACLADTAKATTLANASTEQGEKYKIEGTPTFIINGAKLDANTWPLVKAELEKLGAR